MGIPCQKTAAQTPVWLYVETASSHPLRCVTIRIQSQGTGALRVVTRKVGSYVLISLQSASLDVEMGSGKEMRLVMISIQEKMTGVR